MGRSEAIFGRMAGIDGGLWGVGIIVGYSVVILTPPRTHRSGRGVV